MTGHGPPKTLDQPSDLPSGTQQEGQVEGKCQSAGKHYTVSEGVHQRRMWVAARFVGEEKAQGEEQAREGTAGPPDPGPLDAIHAPPQHLLPSFLPLE